MSSGGSSNKARRWRESYASEQTGQLRRYIEDAKYPVKTAEVVAGTEERGAPQEVIEQLRSLGPQRHFPGPETVVVELFRPPPGPGQATRP